MLVKNVNALLCSLKFHQVVIEYSSSLYHHLFSFLLTFSHQRGFKYACEEYKCIIPIHFALWSWNICLPCITNTSSPPVPQITPPSLLHLTSQHIHLYRTPLIHHHLHHTPIHLHTHPSTSISYPPLSRFSETWRELMQVLSLFLSLSLPFTLSYTLSPASYTKA